MYRLICQKPAHFLSAQMALVSTFLKMFIVLEMYNFDSSLPFSEIILSFPFTIKIGFRLWRYTTALGQKITFKNLGRD